MLALSLYPLTSFVWVLWLLHAKTCLESSEQVALSQSQHVNKAGPNISKWIKDRMPTAYK